MRYERYGVYIAGAYTAGVKIDEGRTEVGELLDLQAARARRQPEPWVSKRAVAEHIGCTTRTVDRWRGEGLPCSKPYANSPVRFKLSEVDAWLRDRAAASATAT